MDTFTLMAVSGSFVDGVELLKEHEIATKWIENIVRLMECSKALYHLPKAATELIQLKRKIFSPIIPQSLARDYELFSASVITLVAGASW